MVRLAELLAARGYVPDPNHVKVVRHKDSRFDIEELRQTGWFETYQQFQGKPVFDGCSEIVVFVGEEGTTGRFVGVYDVGARHPATTDLLAPGCPYPNLVNVGGWHYSLKKRTGFEDLEDRVVIDWGKGALQWAQWFTDRPVLEIRPEGRALPPFRDYLRVHLSFKELSRLVAHPEAHSDWVAGLSAVGGIYLIVHTQTGEQYVGSATGAGGLWHRWCEYAKTGHGGNLKLKAACTQDAECPAAFSFPILETFSRSLVREEALTLESFFKTKLGSRAFGLNAN